MSSTRTFSDDSRLLACARQNWTVRLWDVAQRRVFGKPLQHTARVRAVDFSSDRSMLACASMSESVRIWDVETQTRIHPQFALPGSVSRVHFSNDGQYLAACSLAGPTRVWRTEAAPMTVKVPLEFLRSAFVSRATEDRWPRPMRKGGFTLLNLMVAFRSAKVRQRTAHFRGAKG
jgi:WD40 repeat protein